MFINEWVVAELIWFLGRRMAWSDVQNTLIQGVFETRGLNIENRQVLSEIISSSRKMSDFVDLMNVHLLKKKQHKYIYSYDKGFDRHKGIKRLEP